jgi:hypothetical protein
LPDRRQRIGRGGVVDLRRAGLAGFGEPDERREHGSYRIAVTAQVTRRAAMLAIGETLGDPCTAWAVLRKGGRPVLRSVVVLEREARARKAGVGRVDQRRIAPRSE